MKIFGSVFSLFTGKRCRNPASQDRTRERAQVVRLESFFRQEKSAGKCFCSVFFLKTHRMKNSFLFIMSVSGRRVREILFLRFDDDGDDLLNSGKRGRRAETATGQRRRRRRRRRRQRPVRSTFSFYLQKRDEIKKFLV